MVSRHTDRTGRRSPDEARLPWGGRPPQPEAARRRLVEAAERCIARDGLAATSVASVAAEAGVSRPTVYRYFGDRDALVRDALADATARLRDTIHVAMASSTDAAAMIVEAVVVGLAEIPSEPVLRAVWDATALDAAVVTNVTDTGGRAWVRDCLAPAMERTGWDDAGADEAAEVILRFVLSLLVSPAPRREPAELRAFLARRLLPALGLVPSTPEPIATTPTPHGGTR